MTTPQPNLIIDAALRAALSHRAAGVRTPVELVDDVMTMVGARSQDRGWAVSLAPESRWLRLAVVALIAAAVVGLMLVVGDQPDPLPAGGSRIAFVHAMYDPTGGEPPTDPTIFSVASRGGDPTALAAVPGNVLPFVPLTGGPGDLRNQHLVGPAVSWSPDGTRIAFRLFNDEPGIYVMDADGRNLSRLVDLPVDAYLMMSFSEALDWSPDGTRIAYTLLATSAIYVVNADGRPPEPIDLGIQAHRSVAWSPDGSKLAFTRLIDMYSTDLYVVNADGTGEVRLFGAGLTGHVDAIAWSPDGTQLAFEWQGNPATGNWNLYAINADGSGHRDLGELWVGGCCIFSGRDMPLAWSPDGQLIALIDARDDNPANDDGPTPDSAPHDVVVLAGADGSGLHVLADGSFFDWSPDGSQLVVSDFGGSLNLFEESPESPERPYSISVINVDGTGRRWIANGEYATWAP